MKKKCIVLNITDENKFEDKLNELKNDGYSILSSSCGFVDSSAYDYCTSYQAILELDKKDIDDE